MINQMLKANEDLLNDFKKSVINKEQQSISNLQTIELPFYYPGSNKYEDGWNDCLKEIKLLNKIHPDHVCLMNDKCPCDDCNSSRITKQD